MQSENKNTTPKDKQLKLENELLRLELQEKLGNEMPEIENLPVEVENLLLKSLKSDEENQEKNNMVRLYDYIDQPDFENVENISDEDLKDMLRDLTDYLLTHKIIIDPSFKVSKREMYRFITEDLFNIKIPKDELKGFFSHFRYEDFYPDEHDEIREMIEEFLDRFFIKELQIEDDFFSEKIEVGSDIALTAGEFVNLLKNKKEEIIDFELYKFNLHSLTIDRNISEALYNIDYSITFKNETTLQNEKSVFTGDATFKLEKNEFDFWTICKVSIPGFNFPA
ncbi:MAG: hypothetical protein EA412_08230 [Chitinophagaceae bacterium]|nr:MAG: hypothetical protein EA412_08230 [Chitinophagaceae bacterium]